MRALRSVQLRADQSSLQARHVGEWPFGRRSGGVQAMRLSRFCSVVGARQTEYLARTDVQGTAAEHAAGLSAQLVLNSFTALRAAPAHPSGRIGWRGRVAF